MHTRFLAAVALAAVAAPTPCQILPGHSIATVAVRNQPGEMYDVDHQAGTASLLTVSPSLAAENPNCVLMTSPVTGFVGTNTSPSGNVFSIVVAGSMVTETQLNTTATAGGNVSELTIAGSDLYFCTQDAAGTLGILQSVPLAGGPVTTRLDIATLGATGLANACVAIGTNVYVATFNSSPASSATSPGELIEYDTTTGMGRIVMNLPPGGFTPVGNPWNTGIVNMEEDPLQPGRLVLQGVYGDLLTIDPVAGTVVSSVWTGLLNATGNALASGSVNSFAWDPVAQDWIVGTRQGAIERWVGSQQAEQKIPGVGSSPTVTENSVTGLHHIPFIGGSDLSYGAGCPGNDGWTPTDSSFGNPVSGNAGFRLGLFSANAGDPVVLIADFQNSTLAGMPLPLDLGSRGAPGCLLRSGAFISVLVFTSGSGPGLGQAILPLPIPNGLAGTVLYRQWVELQLSPTNALGVAVSNARQMTVQ